MPRPKPENLAGEVTGEESMTLFEDMLSSGGHQEMRHPANKWGCRTGV